MNPAFESIVNKESAILTHTRRFLWRISRIRERLLTTEFSVSNARKEFHAVDHRQFVAGAGDNLHQSHQSDGGRPARAEDQIT